MSQNKTPFQTEEGVRGNMELYVGGKDNDSLVIALTNLRPESVGVKFALPVTRVMAKAITHFIRRNFGLQKKTTEIIEVNPLKFKAVNGVYQIIFAPSEFPAIHNYLYNSIIVNPSKEYISCRTVAPKKDDEVMESVL